MRVLDLVFGNALEDARGRRRTNKESMPRQQSALGRESQCMLLDCSVGRHGISTREVYQISQPMQNIDLQVLIT
jgi:prophage tail gpP-like protein